MFDDRGTNYNNTEEQFDVTPIYYRNKTSMIYFNDAVNNFHKYYAPFLLSNNQ